MKGGLTRFQLFRRHVNRIGEHPEGPAPKPGKARLGQKNLSPIPAGATDGLIDGPGLLLVNLPPVAKNFNQRKACAWRR